MNQSVRYAAALDTGEGFMAFAGGYLITPEPHLEVGYEVELPEGEILGIGSEVGGFLRVKWRIPVPNEHVYLVNDYPVDALGVTAYDDGYLVTTDRPLIGARWGGKVTEHAFDRAAYIVVAFA